MRMRKLGHGQSVMFCAPVEIDTMIRHAAGLKPYNISEPKNLGSVDVLRWAMLETCSELQHHISHWAQQGVEYNRRAKAEAKYAASKDSNDLQDWKADESRSLKDMYGFKESLSPTSSDFTEEAFGFSDLARQLSYLGVKKLEDPSMDEEQEREVSHEIEREQQIERPPKTHPASHVVHDDLLDFAHTGSVPSNSTSIVSLFHPWRSLGSQHSDAWSSELRATLDFCTTVTASDAAEPSEYMRPLNWIVSGNDNVLVAVSPYEANALIPLIRSVGRVKLHIFAPRLTRSMVSFSDLQFHTVASSPTLIRDAPALPIQLQLNIFAGQLYLRDHTEYRLTCAFLGIYTSSDDGESDGDDIRVQSDGFVKPEDRQGLVSRVPEYAECGFSSSPVSMLKDLIGRRRKGMEYLRTHMGQILHARQLAPSDF
jgi:hypothetical protein